MAAIAIASLVFGFFAATQLRSQLIPPTDRIDRSQALVRSVQQLERVNAGQRGRIASLRSEVDQLEAQAAARSAGTRSLRSEVSDLRAHAGETSLRGPGVVVHVGDAPPAASAVEGGQAGSQDVQDVINVLFAAGAEGVAVDGRRITPMSGYQGSGGSVMIDQGPPLLAPFEITAVGDRNRMESALADPASLPDIRFRQHQYGLLFDYAGGPDLTLPGYDAALQVSFAQPG